MSIMPAYGSGTVITWLEKATIIRNLSSVFYDTDCFKLGPVLLFFSFWLEYSISGPKSYPDFRETGRLGPRCKPRECVWLKSLS